MVWLLYNSNVKKEDQLTHHELMPLPSDKAKLPQKTRKPTKEEADKATVSFFDAMAIFDVSSN